MTQQAINLEETNWNAAISWQLGNAVEREAPLKTSTGCHNTGIHHVGLRAGNPAASAEFFRDVLGMKIVGGSDSDHPFGASAFLSSRPDEESHEIALFANPAFAHIAFKVSSLAEFRSLYAHVIERSIPIKFAANHHTSFAFYFDDPDGNMVEVYWPTGDVSKRQPQMEPLDLSQPDDILLEGITSTYPRTLAAAGRSNETAIVSRRNEVTYVPAGTGPVYRSPMDQISFLITGEQTGGAYFMAEVLVRPGAGNRPHIHSREDETFYMQDGTLTVQVGGKTLIASAGDCVCLPRGIAHCFKNNGSVDAKFLLVAAPAGLERFFEEAFYLASDFRDTPPPMTEAFLGRVLAAAGKYGLELLPPAQ